MKHITDYDINSMYAYQPQVYVYKDYNYAGEYAPTGWSVYQVIEPVGAWIEAQDVKQWDWVPEARKGFMQGYALSPELESWFLMRWS